MKTFLLVCLGGAGGTGARYLLNLGAVRSLGAGFPFATLAVNVVGSLAMGAVTGLALRGVVAPEARAVLATGLLGGFTTYSAFNQELLGGIERGAWGWSVAYGAATVVSCLVAGAAGLWMARIAGGN